MRKVTPTKDGYRFVSEMETRLRAQQDEAPIHGFCFFCDAAMYGPLAEVRRWHRQHREAHPEARPDRGVRARMQAAKDAPRVFVPGRGAETER